MAEALRRIEYDATVDDAVDVSLRLASRTRTFRNQIRYSILIVGALMGVAALFVAMYVAPPDTSRGYLGLLGFAAVFGVVTALIFRGFFAKEIRKQQRKMVAEHFGGKPAIRSEIELRPDAVWVRQAGMEMVFPWDGCTSIIDNPDDIEINFTPGICVVPNRHFASAADRQLFFETSRRLSGK